MAANHGLFALRLAVWLGLSKIVVCQEQVVHAQVCNVQFIILGILVSPSTYHFGVPLLCPQTRFPGSRPLAAKFWCTMLSLKRSAKEGKKKHQILSSKSFPLAWISLENILFKKNCFLSWRVPFGLDFVCILLISLTLFDRKNRKLGHWSW